MIKLMYLPVAALLISHAAAYADDAPAQVANELQLIIQQSGGVVTGLNMAMGRGEDVQFFSNIDESTTWIGEDGPIRTGTYTPQDGNGVVLGVCAGGKCDISQGMSFTTQVGQ